MMLESVNRLPFRRLSGKGVSTAGLEAAQRSGVNVNENQRQRDCVHFAGANPDYARKNFASIPQVAKSSWSPWRTYWALSIKVMTWTRPLSEGNCILRSQTVRREQDEV